VSRSRKPTVATFRSDPLFPRIERAVGATLKTSRVVTPIDVLVCMHLLTPEKVLDWRRGRVPYLERVINAISRVCHDCCASSASTSTYLRQLTTGAGGKGENSVCVSPKRVMPGLRWPTRHILSGQGNRRSIRQRGPIALLTT
jgi:hypothetical protein